MKFADVNGKRQEAQPDLSGECPTCGHAMVAKCGVVRIWHWAHRGRRTCDPWWENETEWHRAWKGQFPVAWQEVVCKAENGEKHIADVKTDYGWVIEFQHSFIELEERRSRDAFYSKLVWVVDGARRKRDKAQFLSAWNEGIPLGPNSLVRRTLPDECLLLREWGGSNSLVFFDFGEPILWWLMAKSLNGWAYIPPFPRTSFVDTHCGSATQTVRDFDGFVQKLGSLVAQYESYLRAQALQQTSQQALGFQQYWARKQRRRRRF